jgi:hypothetical protein
MDTRLVCQTTGAFEREYAAGDQHGRQAGRFHVKEGHSVKYRDHFPVGAPWTENWSRAYVEGHRDGWDAVVE